jgi:modification methylase
MLNTIICGDAFKELQILGESFDVGVTSPPYNKREKDKGWFVDDVKYAGATDNLPEAVYQQNQIAVLNELFRIAKPGASFFYNHKIRWERGKLLHPMDWLRKTKWTIRQEITWNRGIAGNIRGWRFWQIDEKIYWLIKPDKKNNIIGQELKSRHALLTSIWNILPERNNEHPAPFPIEIPTRCIYSILGDEPYGKVVIDPYAGSGTTLVAAKLLHCNYIGIEISLKYAQIARNRLDVCENEGNRVRIELERHKVLKTFKQRKAEGEWDKKVDNGTKQATIFG